MIKKPISNVPLPDDLDNLLSLVAQNVNHDNDLEFLKSQVKIGKYEIQRMLGVGGQAICFLAIDKDLNRKVVLKLYKQSLSESRRNQIFQEGRALAKVHSPNIAQCYGVELFNDRPYLVLEYIEGETLENWVKNRTVAPTLVSDIVAQIATALESTHESQLLHLDVKPSNIIINSKHQISLIDFGLSQATFGDKPETVAGSPSFLAPRMLDPRRCQ